MAWTYSQLTGEMHDPTKMLVEQGYAGHGPYVDKPRAEWRENEGPLPTGFYTMEAARDDASMGPCVIPLTPDPANNMHGRSGFYIHGDNSEGDQSASEGCIILSRPTRDLIAASVDRMLEVIALAVPRFKSTV